jgi:cobalt-zinc-cadmium efflux system outer membrane protein
MHPKTLKKGNHARFSRACRFSRVRNPGRPLIFSAYLLLSIVLSGSAYGQMNANIPIKDFPAPPAGGTQPTRQQRTITLEDAVSIFLQQNLEVAAARYDVDLVDAEKLSAKLRPNPEIDFEVGDVPISFGQSILRPDKYSYGISQTFELGGKRQKRIDAANKDSELAEAEFQVVLWQMTSDVKRKFYSVLLAKSLLDLAKENETTFTQIVDHTNDVFKLGEISGLDLKRLEIEKLRFDTDVANAERDYELALRDLRFTLGGDYRTMDIEAAGTIDYYKLYDFSVSELRTKAIGARPDLKAAQLSETAAAASIRLQNAQRVPDITLGASVETVPGAGSTYNVGFSIPIPLSDRNQSERAKALIQKMKAQNDQQLIANRILNDVDKALIAYQIQKRRVELYKSGVLTKINEVQTLTEVSLKEGESSILELLDSIRTRRDALAEFYQTIFDYQMSLLDLELATATPLQ